MTHSTVARVGLGILAAIGLQIGLWATLAPRSWFDDFPGLGRAWVSVDGVFNEHLARDVGAAYLALGALAVWAAVRLGPDLVRAAAGAWLVFGVPHLGYHLTTTDLYGTADNAASLGGLAAALAVPVLLLRVAARLAGTQDSRPAPAPDPTGEPA